MVFGMFCVMFDMLCVVCDVMYKVWCVMCMCCFRVWVCVGLICDVGCVVWFMMYGV